MATNVTEQVRCQPFMTRITRIEGKILHFSSGASSGIRPGDTLALYRTFNFYDSERLTGVELDSVKTALTVSQVHPNFSSGTISVDPGRLNIQEDDLLINLASSEYFKAVPQKALKVPMITPVFKELKNGDYKIVMTYAKKARGLMVRYIVDNNVNSLDELKGFNTEGYGFSETLSTETELVFTR